MMASDIGGAAQERPRGFEPYRARSAWEVSLEELLPFCTRSVLDPSSERNTRRFCDIARQWFCLRLPDGSQQARRFQDRFKLQPYWQNGCNGRSPRAGVCLPQYEVSRCDTSRGSNPHLWIPVDPWRIGRRSGRYLSRIAGQFCNGVVRSFLPCDPILLLL